VAFICAVLLGTLNDRLLLVNPTDINPRRKRGVEIKSCLVGLLEPLIGFATMQQHFEQKLDLSEVLYQITSRYWILFDSFQQYFISQLVAFVVEFSSAYLYLSLFTKGIVYRGQRLASRHLKECSIGTKEIVWNHCISILL
jgi:hypothetical protein